MQASVTRRHPRSLRSFVLLLFSMACLSGPPGASGQSVSEAELIDLEKAATQSYIEDDLKTAAALYRQLAELHTEVVEKTRMLITVASIEHDQGRIDRAVATMAQVLTLDPEYQLRPELYGESFVPLFYEAKKAAEEARRALATNQVSDALARLASGDEAGAKRLLEEAVALRSDHPEALYNLALLNLREGHGDAAMAGFQKVVALAESQPGKVDDDTLSRALTNVGLLYLRGGNHADAADALQRAVQLDESNGPAWSNLGVALRALRRTAEAARAFSRAYDRDPADPTNVSNLAVVYLDSGDADSAVRLLEEATGRLPARPDLWLHLGTGYRKLDRNQDAVRALQAALRNDPNNAERVAERAALEMALVQYRLNNPRASLEAADRVLEMRSDSVDALLYRALAQESLGDLEPARQTLERARQLAPTRGIVFLNLGNVLFRLGDWDGAEQAFVRALELDPASATARSNLDDLRDARRRGAVPPSPGSTSVDRPASQPAGGSAQTAPREVDAGLVFSDVDYAALGLQGAMVERVRPASAAGRAGLRDGDLLLRLDGETLAGEDDFLRRLGRKTPGSRVEVAILRNNREMTVEMVVP